MANRKRSSFMMMITVLLAIDVLTTTVMRSCALMDIMRRRIAASAYN